ncbi:ImmA/IrrE family metallo-endopeptidase [Microbispora bryophytorum]|uniref:ImmA/IrrE family metallo-endopeptidase n=1 Tax=Microbispora bryophytorum TaxID=1460882 RepID=UPI003400726C
MTARNDVPELYPANDLDYAVPPGETLKELLEERGMSQRDLAARTGLSPKHVNQLVHGLVPLSADIAMRLETVTGTPARLWNRMEADYRTSLQRLRQHRDWAQYEAWLDEQPVKDLVKRGYLPEGRTNKATRIEQLLSFFSVATIEAWHDVYIQPVAAFRKSSSLESKTASLAAWLRLGEIKAQEVRCKAFDPRGLRSALPQLRALTVEPPEVFEPKMVEICAQYGVAVVFVAEIKGCRTSGATLRRGPCKIIILSLRHKTDDHLWFTFFHEIGHLLLHGDDKVRIDVALTQDADDQQEQEANEFAADLLIPREQKHRLTGLRSKVAVIDFARELGIAPGIVVGRLQRDKHRAWPWENGNGLKRKFELTEV